MSALLFPAAIRAQLLANGRQTAEGLDHDPMPVVKLFSPYMGGTWLLTELDPEEPDIAFGLCDLGVGFPDQRELARNLCALVPVGPGESWSCAVAVFC